MNRLTCLPATLLLMAGVATAQPAGPPAPPRDDDGHGDTGSEVDRPLARALAFERRDVVEELLRSPGSANAASAAELAEDVRVPRPHAELIVAAAKAGQPLETLESLLRAGVPEGVTVDGRKLASATAAQLVEAGMSEAQAREFLRFRNSARRVHQHFREVKAIREAREAGARNLGEAGREFMRMTNAEKVRAVARALGLSAPAAEAELARLERLPEAERVARRAALLEGSTGSGGRDVLASFRRGDGTVEWSKLLKDQGFRGASGVTHFAFALFLKELAIVMKTGDRGRLEEFIDGLMSTDFFVNYGLFAAGASAADVVYGKYVRRITRKQFLSGVLRSNLVLAAGLAVPMVARGKFTLDSYIVDVAALGLSATAVKAAVEGTKGVYALVRRGRPLVNLGRLAGPAGWVYSAGEAAVVLLLADHLAARFDRFLDERALRKRVHAAEGLLEALAGRLRSGEQVPEADLEAALNEYGDSYDALRRDRMRPVEGHLTSFRGELEEAGRTATIDETAVSGLRDALARNPALSEALARRHGSVDRYLEDAAARRSAPVEARMRDASARFDRDWREGLDSAYVGAPAPDGAPEEGSRLALYDEETTALLRALDVTRDPEARRLIALAIERARVGRRVDRVVYDAGRGATGAAPAPATASPTEGLTGGVRREVGLPEAAAVPVPSLEEWDRVSGEMVPPMGPSVVGGTPR